ncbi:MAG: hypothetical protein KUG80_03770 [Gammaproteobacteria bacterium]|nr:hypothetical protein [Gammaproteobacteria bacterium]
MNLEQEAIRKADADQRFKENRDDYNNELAGNNVGRIQRFGFDHVRKEAVQEEKRKKSALDQMMLSEAYRAAWTGAMDAVNKADDAVYKALVDASNDLSIAQKTQKDLLDNAATTKGGTKVFRDKDGNAYTENGERLCPEIMANIMWADNAPTWEKYSESKEYLTSSQDRYNDVNTKSDRLVEIREELTDNDNPASIDLVTKLEQEANDIRESLSVAKISHELELTSEKPTHIPDLQLTF